MADKFDFDKFDDAPEEMDFDQFQDTEDSIPMGGEMGLSDIVTEEYTRPGDEAPLPKISQGEAALAGAGQGLTFGFADELGGAQQQGMDWLHSLFGDSLTEANKKLAEEGFTGDIGPTSGEELYKEGTAENRRQLAAAEEQHPKTAFAADMLSSLAVPIPGAAAVRVGGKVLTKAAPKVARMAQKGVEAVKGLSKAKKGATLGAGVGAIEAAGRTEEDLLSAEGATDVALGAGLGAGLGSIGGKISEKFEAGQMAKKSDELLEEAEDLSLRTAGATAKEMEKAGEKQISDEIKGAGVTAIEEGIIDPMIKPKSAWKRAVDVKNRLKQGYDEITDRFTGRSNLGNAQANVIAERQSDEVIEAVEDALSETADIGETAEKRIREDLGTLKEELAFAYQSNNPIKELQELYVRHNDKFFSDIKSDNGAGQARKSLRSKLKEIQRNYAKILNPEAYEDFAKLDKQYSEILDIEKMTKRTHGKGTSGVGISDLGRGAVAGMLTKSPLVSGLVTGGSIAAKKFGGKDIAKFLDAVTAKRLLNKSKKLKEYAGEIPRKGYKESIENAEGLYGKGEAIADRLRMDVSKTARKAISEAPEASAIAPVMVGTAATEMITDENKITPRKLHQRTAQMVQRATPEQLAEHAQSIREEFGEKGEQLASELENMSEKNKMQRTATMFKIMQNPQHKRMLMPDLYK